MRARARFFLPNRLSYLRILIGLFIPFLLVGSVRGEGFLEAWAFWSALGLFLLGTFTDFWDGWVARRYKLETPWGRVLDPTADKIFILATMGSFAALRVYSHWWLVPIFLREIAVTFSRIVWMRHGEALGAERAGKVKLGFQVVSVFFSFLYLGLPTPGTFFLNHFFLILALGLTLYSGFFFFLHNRRLLTQESFLRSVASLGVGYLKPFPGTYGSLLGLLVIPLVAHDPWLHAVIFLLVLLLAYGTISRLGLSPEEDPLEIVMDEFCGILLAFWTIPLGWGSLLVGFCLFRFFDVVKVFPLGWLEKRKGPYGIVLDDLGAGVYTWLVLKILFR